MMLLKKKQIFIVEDDPGSRVMFQVSLVQDGATVDFERRGRDTLYHLNNLDHVDVIILDLMLSDDISGFDLYDEIRAQPRYRDTPILAVSAMDAAQVVPRVRSKGFAGFIAKPVDSGIFPELVARVIDGEEVWYLSAGELQ